MNSNRRNFIKTSLVGAGPMATGLSACTPAQNEKVKEQNGKKHTQRFNMSGYAAPKLEIVRIGFVGLGHRGPGAVERMSYIEGVEIVGLCDPALLDIQSSLAAESNLQFDSFSNGYAIYLGWFVICSFEDKFLKSVAAISNF